MPFDVSYPTPPNPQETAAAQTASNKETAIANANLNRVDQYGPQGTVKYTVIGTNADGTPKYRQDTTLSPESQALYDNYNAIANRLGQFGISQGDKVAGILSNPLDLNTQAEKNIVSLQRQDLDPQWQQQEDSLRTRLINSGVRPGTDAYDREMANFQKQKQSAYNSMYLGARQQGVNEALQQRSVPLNELMAVMQGQQVNNPQYAPVPTTAQANTDVAGIYQNNFANQMAIANAQNASNNAMLGGLFGLGSMGIYKWSDRRLKRDVVRVGELASGLPVYEYAYVWGGPRQTGVMADEARALFPDAVRDVGGFLAVDYGKVR